MADKKMTRLADPQTAIASYLDELLHTATDTALREEAEAPEPVKSQLQEPRVTTRTEPAPVPSVEKPAARQKPVQEKPAEPVRPSVRQAPEAPAPKQTVEVKPQPAPEPAAPSTRPEWSEQPFECLIFTVAGLQLAVPLILLGAIHRIEEEIRPIPGSPRWYMGIRPDQDHNLRVVDTAEWIMAGRVSPGARDNYRFVIRLDNSDWGLACDDVAQSFTLRPDEVRWRTARSKRPWLAGTVIDQMCALIDVRTMADLLVRAEREHHLDLS